MARGCVLEEVRAPVQVAVMKALNVYVILKNVMVPETSLSEPGCALPRGRGVGPSPALPQQGGARQCP